MFPTPSQPQQEKAFAKAGKKGRRGTRQGKTAARERNKRGGKAGSGFGKAGQGGKAQDDGGGGALAVALHMKLMKLAHDVTELFAYSLAVRRL